MTVYIAMSFGYLPKVVMMGQSTLRLLSRKGDSSRKFTKCMGIPSTFGRHYRFYHILRLAFRSTFDIRPDNLVFKFYQIDSIWSENVQGVVVKDDLEI